MWKLLGLFLITVSMAFNVFLGIKHFTKKPEMLMSVNALYYIFSPNLQDGQGIGKVVPEMTKKDTSYYIRHSNEPYFKKTTKEDFNKFF